MFNKDGFITKITEARKSGFNCKYKIKYTVNNGQIKKMKVYVAGRLYKNWSFKYGSQKGTQRQYRSMINSMAAMGYPNYPGQMNHAEVDMITIFNLDNVYKNVF